MPQQPADGEADTMAPDPLPATFAALGAGQIHPVHLRIIEDETRILSDADAAKADQVLAEAAPGMTFGELRSAARKLILKLDPEAVTGNPRVIFKRAGRRQGHRPRRGWRASEGRFPTRCGGRRVARG